MSNSVPLERDPTARAPGQYTRSIVQRLRMRTLLTLGGLAAATTVGGRRFGWQDPRFLAAEVAMLTGDLRRSPAGCCHRWIATTGGRRGKSRWGGCWRGWPGQGWHVVHDASLGRGNVDHILIGPGGVFTVETKSHPGPVRVGRLHGGVLSQAQAQRKAVEGIVGEHVEPLVVFSRAWVDRPLSRRKGVRVVPARMLLGYVDRQPQRLSAEEVERAHARLAQALAEHLARTRYRPPKTKTQPPRPSRARAI